MRNFTLTFAFLISSVLSFGQCYPDRHNTSWFDGWISCESSPNPNSLRGEGHWISYDFGTPYELNELKIWNINDPDLLLYGVKDISIDYSLDGVNWTSYGNTTVPLATGISTYEGEDILNFNGLKVRYLLITVVNNYGGDCTGFAEMRVSVNPSKDENEDVCMFADIFPNPFDENFSVVLKKKCLGDVYLAIEDATGRTVIAEELIKLNEVKLITAKTWTPGVYYACLRNGDLLERYKVVKF